MMRSPFPRASLAPLALLLALLPGRPVPAQQAGDGDLARRTFQNAEQLMREGKREQAVRDYQQVVQAFPDSEFADDALMRLGSYHYPSESLSELGAASVQVQQAARPFFEQVRERYPQADSAPHALYKLGLLALEPSSPRRNLDEAYASFSRVVNIYPGSDWVGQAHLGAAYSELSKYNYDRAILASERALEATYGDAPSAEAHFFLGVANARLGAFVRAAEAFQRSIDRHPQGGFAESALNWLTLIYRTRLLPGAGQPPRHRPVQAFVPRMPAGEDLRGDLHMAVSPSGDLVVADPKEGRVLTFSRDGALKDTRSLKGASLAAFDAFGSLILAGEAGLRVAGTLFVPARTDGGKIRPVEKVAGVFRSSDRRTWVLDAKEGELLTFESEPASPTVIVSDKAAGTRMTAMAAGPENRLYVLDSKENRLMVLEGRELNPVAPGGIPVTFQRPVDLASDPLGNIYVLDVRRNAVVVLDPEGSELGLISPPDGSPHALEEPGCVAVGPAGEVYVYDKRKRTILLYD